MGHPRNRPRRRPGLPPLVTEIPRLDHPFGDLSTTQGLDTDYVRSRDRAGWGGNLRCLFLVTMAVVANTKEFSDSQSDQTKITYCVNDSKKKRSGHRRSMLQSELQRNWVSGTACTSNKRIAPTTPTLLAPSRPQGSCVITGN